ncbi:DNA cytosine methyltransferase [Candidatus Kaiserbacteria bacterium]|nr:DNA cytosine methyltransferase [Candidatus Kaiserbacteria bacterium]
MRVADFFCGAGGFSEGFRQKGFDVVFALDNWEPAVKTHDLNHPDCKCVQMDILNLDTPAKIDAVVPDVDIIIGSPPCVAFSGSNKAGKADKSLGIKLIEAYLRIVAWKSKGTLKYWILENVPNSGNYIKEKYSWRELGLPGKGPDLEVRQRNILNAALYGAPQKRKRFVCGDYPVPIETNPTTRDWVTMAKVMNALTNPLCNKKPAKITDPLYGFSIPSSQLTDHFYDSHVEEYEWSRAKRLKEDHGFMGKMDFPERLDRAARTVMATMSASTRESMIFAAKKDGKDAGFRLPTIREIATFMSFPINYQFEGGNEGTKYKLVGNAVCCKLSAALAAAIAKRERIPLSECVAFPSRKPSVNLNGMKRIAKSPKPKRPDARFSVHIPYLKIKGFRVELTNKGFEFGNSKFKWTAILHHGSGKDAKKATLTERDVESMLSKEPGFKRFKKLVETEFKNVRVTSAQLQESYVLNDASKNLTPDGALMLMKSLVDKAYPESKFGETFIENTRASKGISRSQIPLRVLAGMYACTIFVHRLS